MHFPLPLSVTGPGRILASANAHHQIMVPDHRFAANMLLRKRAIAPSHLFCNVDVARQFAVNSDLNVEHLLNFPASLAYLGVWCGRGVPVALERSGRNYSQLAGRRPTVPACQMGPRASAI